MRDFNSRIQTSDSMIYWFLNGNQMDFTYEEYREIVVQIRRIGLYKYLTFERPVLYERLQKILDEYNDSSSEPIDDHEREYVLEQMIFDIESRI